MAWVQGKASGDLAMKSSNVTARRCINHRIAVAGVPSVRLRPGHQSSLVHAALPEALEAGGSTLPIVAATFSPIAGLLGWRLSLYSQLEVITARMMANFVPQQARVVVQLGGTTRDLFYYPKKIGQVTVVGEDITPGLFDQAGFQAQTPTIARKQSPTNLGFIPDASVDAVVCLKTISQADTPLRQEQIVAEACRILKPGCNLIFIEPLSDDASPLRGLIGNPGSASAMAASSLEDLLDRPTLKVLQVDVALPGADPFAVGVASRTTAASTGVRVPRASRAADAPSEPDLEDVVRGGKRKIGSKGASDKGFVKK